MGIEDPDADAAEQRRLVTDLDEDEQEEAGSTQPPWEADPADFAEQHRVVDSADDDEPHH
jgi:hypothetical protein